MFREEIDDPNIETNNSDINTDEGNLDDIAKIFSNDKAFINDNDNYSSKEEFDDQVDTTFKKLWWNHN